MTDKAERTGEPRSVVEAVEWSLRQAWEHIGPGCESEVSAWALAAYWFAIAAKQQSLDEAQKAEDKEWIDNLERELAGWEAAAKTVRGRAPSRAEMLAAAGEYEQAEFIRDMDAARDRIASLEREIEAWETAAQLTDGDPPTRADMEAQLPSIDELRAMHERMAVDRTHDVIRTKGELRPGPVTAYEGLVQPPAPKMAEGKLYFPDVVDADARQLEPCPIPLPGSIEAEVAESCDDLLQGDPPLDPDKPDDWADHLLKHDPGNPEDIF